MKLLLADDHTLFRDALVTYITRADAETEVAVAKDFYEAMEAMKKDPIRDLVLLDLRMPGMNDLDGFKKFREIYPDVPVVLISGTAEPKSVKEAMDLGAAGYFPKTLSGKALMNAINIVLSGEKFIPHDHLTGDIMPSYQGRQEPAQDGEITVESFRAMSDIHLTPRESQVLGFLAKGASNKDIANEMGVQVVTVKLHVRGVCRKLEVKNRTQAALKAKDLGLA